jgi:hypothetical protein
MYLNSDRRRPFLLGLVAFASVLVSHYVAYYLAAPDPHYRDALLHSSGHRYFVYLAGGLLGLLSAAASIWLRSDVQGKETRRAGFRFAFPRLLILQVGGFLALEITERLAFGDGISHLLSDIPIAIGLALQIVVAIAGALSLSLVARVVGRLLRRGRRRKRASGAWLGSPSQQSLTFDSAVLSGGAAPRAPPALPV